MDIYKHYANGSTHINSNGTYSGYEPSRTETILAVHIQTVDYSIHIYPDAITIIHKYLRLTPHYFTVGKRKQYPIDALETFTGNERKRLHDMYSVLNELLTEHSIEGEAVNDWGVVRVLATHAE